METAVPWLTTFLALRFPARVTVNTGYMRLYVPRDHNQSINFI